MCRQTFRPHAPNRTRPPTRTPAHTPRLDSPWAYRAYGSSKEDNPPCEVPGFEGTEMQLLRHVSFVDCPGASARARCCVRRRARTHHVHASTHA